MRFRLFKVRLLAARFTVCLLRGHNNSTVTKYERGRATVFDGCLRCGRGDVRKFIDRYPLPRQITSR